MSVPVSQMWTVASYVVGQKLAGRKQYPLVLMLEPLFRCNLACAGCGKIQYPAHILKRQLTPEECFKAVDECGAHGFYPRRRAASASPDRGDR
jgi:MoaA/NifB/PqqE/SkfB family radical SAM enzyme